jgi:nitrogen regulatory protein PII
MQAMKLVTMITETLAHEALDAVLVAAGTRRWTTTEVTGAGAAGGCGGEMPDLAKFRVETLVREEIAVDLLRRIEREMLPRYAMVEYVATVEVPHAQKL